MPVTAYPIDSMEVAIDPATEHCAFVFRYLISPASGETESTPLPSIGRHALRDFVDRLQRSLAALDAATESRPPGSRRN